jgi:hypothetical protein
MPTASAVPLRRAGLVPEDQWRTYPYSGSIFPGDPNLSLRADDHWDRFWRIYQHDQNENFEE